MSARMPITVRWPLTALKRTKSWRNRQVLATTELHGLVPTSLAVGRDLEISRGQGSVDRVFA